MAFEYVPVGRSTTPGLQYGTMGQGTGQQQQQGQSSFNPKQILDLYKQFQGAGTTSTGLAGNTSGMLSLGSGSAGLGGSGLIGSSGGAISAGSTGGASFGLGGSLVGGSGTIGGSTFAGGAGASALGGAGATGAAGAAGGGAAAGGSAASGAGAASGGGIAAAGPWAALAAAIVLNEKDSRKKGLRAENNGEYAKDVFSGKVFTQDIDGKWGPMQDKWTGGKASKWGLVGDEKGASQIMSLRIGPGIKTLWKDGSIGKLRKLF